MSFETAVFVIVAILALGSILAWFFRENRIVVGLSAMFGFLSAVYFVRNIVLPDGIFPSAFDAQQCIYRARREGLVFQLATAAGKKDVRDFRSDAEVISHTGHPVLKPGSTEHFQIFYNPVTSRFDILLNLIQGDATPNMVANRAAVFLQKTLCLRKTELCELKYEIKAPRATNVSFPELTGQSFKFRFCD